MWHRHTCTIFRPRHGMRNVSVGVLLQQRNTQAYSGGVLNAKTSHSGPCCFETFNKFKTLSATRQPLVFCYCLFGPISTGGLKLKLSGLVMNGWTKMLKLAPVFIVTRLYDCQTQSVLFAVFEHNKNAVQQVISSVFLHFPPQVRQLFVCVTAIAAFSH